MFFYEKYNIIKIIYYITLFIIILTTEEKIDEIYDYIKKKQKQEKIKFIYRIILFLLFLWYVFYMYFILVPEYMDKYKVKNIFEKIKTNFNNIKDLDKNNISKILEKKSISKEDTNKLKEKLNNILKQKNKKDNSSDLNF